MSEIELNHLSVYHIRIEISIPYEEKCKGKLDHHTLTRHAKFWDSLRKDRGD